MKEEENKNLRKVAEELMDYQALRSAFILMKSEDKKSLEGVPN
jgi:hypothetical protein